MASMDIIKMPYIMGKHLLVPLEKPHSLEIISQPVKVLYCDCRFPSALPQQERRTSEEGYLSSVHKEKEKEKKRKENGENHKYQEGQKGKKNAE